ncbi:MAG: rhomboid family intramembrane serine protease [Planctomycetota bacterium]
MIPLKDDNPTLHFPVVTIVLIALNVLVFLWQMSGAGAQHEKVLRFAAIPFNLTQGDREVGYLEERDRRGQVVDYRPVVFERGQRPDAPGFLPSALPAWATLLSSMFMHGGLMHILGNMLFLWIFGNNVEDAMGRVRFLVFYLLTGLAASAAHVFSNPESVIPTLGASGAVSGILGAYLVLYPRAQVLALIPLGVVMMTQRLPAVLFLGLWFAMQIFSLLGAQAGVAWYAHVGGFAVGAALIKLFESAEHRGRGPHRPAFRSRSFQRPW